MLKRFKIFAILLLTFGFLILIYGQGYADDGVIQINEPIPPIYLYAGSTVTKQYTPPPSSFYLQRDARSGATADIQVTYVGSWPNAARTAFEYAASIWETQINSTVPIVVEVEYKLLEPTQLGGAAPGDFYIVSRTSEPDTIYPVSLTNILFDDDVNGNDPEIVAVFNNSINWYFGVDGNTPANAYDFVSVVLHEIGHGLGFYSTMRIEGNIGLWGFSSGNPIIYDRFLENGSGVPLVNGFPNRSVPLSNQLRSNNIYFNGVFANGANGGRVQLYAPNPWIQGSSISHLDQNRFQPSPNGLMRPFLDSGQAIHDPGPVALGILRDLGWPPPNQAPVISGFPAQFLAVGESKMQAIDLWRYVRDDRSADSQLTFEIISISDSNAGVTLTGNRYININPAEKTWEGTSIVRIRVRDQEGLSSIGSFAVFSGEVTTSFLPIVIKR